MTNLTDILSITFTKVEGEIVAVQVSMRNELVPQPKQTHYSKMTRGLKYNQFMQAWKERIGLLLNTKGVRVPFFGDSEVYFSLQTSWNPKLHKGQIADLKNLVATAEDLMAELLYKNDRQISEYRDTFRKIDNGLPLTRIQVGLSATHPFS